MIFAIVLLFWTLCASYLPFHYRRTRFIQGIFGDILNVRKEVCEFFRDLAATYAGIWVAVYHADLSVGEQFCERLAPGMYGSNGAIVGILLFLATVILMISVICSTLALSYLYSFA